MVQSAIWAAAGDALGWITELAPNDSTLIARIGRDRVDRPVKWRRRIGGRTGVTVELPAGTYSDDTQLRLAVCRCIRGNKIFDVEAFARIELTVWQSYALGAGRGTKAAASNLTKRGVNWFSNFFSVKEQNYFQAGGNGAAMRIQPHVWSSPEDFELNVLKDSIVTHGHPHGFCGAIFHAHALNRILQGERTADPNAWFDIIDGFTRITRTVDEDAQLAMFWRPHWERERNSSFMSEMMVIRDETLGALERVTRIDVNDSENYYRILKELGCLEPSTRGSGIRTAIAASVAASMFSESRPDLALVAVANERESDTDTIATMAGALLGAATSAVMPWSLQDKDYIEREARRMARFARGEKRNSFPYPDLARWSPPSSQIDAVTRTSDGYALAGLGELHPIEPETVTTDAAWQWFSLRFGQTVLAKRRVILETASPGPRELAPTPGVTTKDPTPKPSAQVGLASTNKQDSAPNLDPQLMDNWLDTATQRVIQSDFDGLTLGNLLNECIDRYGSTHSAVAFAALVAKAKIARQRR